jgi:hypothetical protein
MSTLIQSPQRTSNCSSYAVNDMQECSSRIVPIIAHTTVDFASKVVTSNIRFTLGAFQRQAKFFGSYRGCALLPDDKITAAEPERPVGM